MTVHKMSLSAGPFTRIQNGSQQIELRLMDEKRVATKLGDTLIFTLSTDESQALERTVGGLLHYATFSELIDDVPVGVLGFNTAKEAKDAVYEFYTPEKESINGVLGIRLK